MAMLAGVKHSPLATLLGKVMIGDMHATVTKRLNPHLSSLLEPLRRGFAQPTISAYCYRLLMSESNDVCIKSDVRDSGGKEYHNAVFA
jgi:hypothetical protein